MEVLRVASVDRTITFRGDKAGTVRTVFKGGTSLSRAYRLIHRFSEDIDLLVIFPVNDGGPGVSARDGLLKQILRDVHEHLGPKRVAAEPRGSTTGIKRNMQYRYPLHAPAHSVLSEGVLLEMGSRGGPEPMDRCSLRSIVADYAVDQLGDPEDQWEEFAPFEVNVLGAERTLLEKLSAVHSITANIGSREPPAGWARHFYDIHQILQSEDIRARLIAMGPEEVTALIDDIEERSVAGGFDCVARPTDGYASSPAFDLAAPVAAEIRGAYESVAGLMYGSVVPLGECIATVQKWAVLL